MITITDKALKHLQASLSSSTDDVLGLRLALRDAGCSGYAYVFDFTKQIDASDHVFEFENVKIIIADEHLKGLQGTELDLVSEGINSVLKFNNPNVINACGCGESFQLKD